METFLIVIILALAVNLMANMIWKYLPYTDKRADVWVTIILIIVCILIIVSRKEPTQVSTIQPPPPVQELSYEIKRYNDAYLEGKIGEAKKRVSAIGTFLTPIPPARLNDLIDRINRDIDFKVELVLMNPDSEMFKERIKNEESSDYQEVKMRIEKKLSDFNKLISQRLSPEGKKRLILKCSNKYPTVSVYIVDDDLYAYSYTHHEIASGAAAVIIFRKYKDNPEVKYLADFFVRHLDSTIGDAKEVTDGKCK